MSFTILSGAGNGKEAYVDDNNRLATSSITESLAELAAINGAKYNINTGNITLTDDTETPVLYFKNNERFDYRITSLIYNIGQSTGGSGDALITTYFNPAGGTIISNAVPADIVVNTNLGSADTLTADIYKGATGDTFTDGTASVSTLVQTPTKAIIGSLDIIVPKGQSLVSVITPPPGNTSLTVQAIIVGYSAIGNVTGRQRCH